MPLSMHHASIPVFVRTLQNLSGIEQRRLCRGQKNRSVRPHQRCLAPDMYTLARQVQIATDGAKGCAARLAGLDVPVYHDTETTFPELQERIAKTIAFVQSVSAAQIDGSEDRDITLKIRNKEVHFKGQPYLLTFVLPNLFFHVTTAYAILRHNGVEIGKYLSGSLEKFFHGAH